MTPDEQEAGSRKYGNDVIILLPLKSGSIAVFNNARELCGIIPHDYHYDGGENEWDLIRDLWRKPASAPQPVTRRTTLEDLGL